jgi:hypothetical protein
MVTQSAMVMELVKMQELEIHQLPSAFGMSSSFWSSFDAVSRVAESPKPGKVSSAQ